MNSKILMMVLQVFRSIDSQCVVGFPKDNNEAYDRGLVTGVPLLLQRRFLDAA